MRMDLIWNNPPVSTDVFFRQEAFNKYACKKSLRNYLCEKEAELNPGFDLLSTPTKLPPPKEENDKETSPEVVSRPAAEKESKVQTDVAKATVADPAARDSTAVPKSTTAPKSTAAKKSAGSHQKPGPVDINEFQRIARERLEAWRKASAEAKENEDQAKDGAPDPSKNEVISSTGKGNNKADNRSTEPSGQAAQGKDGQVVEDIAFDATEPEPEELRAYRGILPCKGKACQIQYPHFSRLNKPEQAQYMKLYLKFENQSKMRNAPPPDAKEMQVFKELQMKVLVEQKEYMEHLEYAAKCTPEDYTYIHMEAKTFIEEYMCWARKRVYDYERYYVQLDSISLAPPRIIKNPPPFVHVQSLLEMGIVPKIVKPGGLMNEKGRPHVPLDYDRLKKKFPPEPSTSPDFWHNQAGSLDVNAERLTKKYKTNIVMSSESLQCLIDNHAPLLERLWEMPVVIKEYITMEDNEEYVQRVVYVDCPFPPKVMTTRDKNHRYHDLALRILLQHPQHECTIDLSTELNSQHQKTLPSQMHKKQPAETTSRLEDPLFGTVDTSSLDSFGIGGARKKSQFSFASTSKKPETSAETGQKAAKTDVKKDWIKFVSGGVVTTGKSEGQSVEPENPKDQSSKLTVAGSNRPSDEKAETGTEKSYSRRQSEGFIVGLVSVEEDSRSSGDSRSPRARVKSNRSSVPASPLSSPQPKARDPNALADKLHKQSVSQNLKIFSDPDSSDDDEKLHIDVIDQVSPARMTRHRMKSQQKQESDAKGPVPKTRSKDSAENSPVGKEVLEHAPAASPSRVTRSRSTSERDNIISDPEGSLSKDSAELEFRSPPRITRTRKSLESPSTPVTKMTRRSRSLQGGSSVQIDETVDKSQEIISPAESMPGIKTRRMSGQAKRSPPEDGNEGAPKRRSLRSGTLHADIDDKSLNSNVTAHDVAMDTEDDTTHQRKRRGKSNRVEAEVPPKRCMRSASKVATQSKTESVGVSEAESDSEGEGLVIDEPKSTNAGQSPGSSGVKDRLQESPASPVDQPSSPSRDCPASPPLDGPENPPLIPMGDPPSPDDNTDTDMTKAQANDTTEASCQDSPPKPEIEHVSRKGPVCIPGAPDKKSQQSAPAKQSKVLETLEIRTETKEDEEMEKKAKRSARRIGLVEQTLNKLRLGLGANAAGTLKRNITSAAAVKESPLDSILHAQDELKKFGQSKPPPAAAKPVVTISDEHLDIPQHAVPAWVPLEKPEDFLQPSEHNVTYNKWLLGDIPILLRSNYEGQQRLKNKPMNFLNLMAKLEYQPNCGLERETVSEVSRAWLAVYTHRHSRLLQARINIFNSEVMMFEEKTMAKILHPNCQFNPGASLTVLHGILERLTRLPVGSYLLSHTPGNSHCHIKKSVETNRGVYDLHMAYANAVTHDDALQVPWIPIDPSILMPFHKIHGRVPATFNPPDPNRPQTFKKKKKRNRRKGGDG